MDTQIVWILCDGLDSQTMVSCNLLCFFNFEIVLQHNQWLHCVAKKLHPFYFHNNFVKSRSILIIFGEQIPKWICNKTMTKLSTSPNECHYTTLWNTTCFNLFITTVIQALNLMTNWQLHSNPSQQMFKVCALRWFRHWLIAWSVMLCWIPDQVKIISSGTFT